MRSSIPARWARQERLVVLPRDGGAPRELPPTNDKWRTLIGWTGDSRRVLFLEGRSVQRVLGAIPLDRSLFGRPDPFHL